MSLGKNQIYKTITDGAKCGWQTLTKTVLSIADCVGRNAATTANQKWLVPNPGGALPCAPPYCIIVGLSSFEKHPFFACVFI